MDLIKKNTVKVCSFLIVVFLALSCLSLSVNANTYCSVTVIDYEDNSAIANAYISIKNSDGKMLSFSSSGGAYYYSASGGSTELKTNIAGKVILHDLPEGTYSAVEIALPGEYNSSLETKSFNTYSNSNITIENTKKYGSLAVKVSDPDNNSANLNSSRFELRDSNNKVVYFTKSKNIYYYSYEKTSINLLNVYNNRIDLYELPVGSYTLIQTKAANGYNVSKNQSFQITNTKNTQKVISVTNTLSSGNISISSNVSGVFKYSVITKDNTSLHFKQQSNGTYVYSNDGTTEIITNSNGDLLLKSIPTGTYYIKCESVPNGYISSTSQKGVVVSSGSTSKINFSVVASNKNISFKDNDGKGLAGVTITVYGNGDKEVSNLTTDNNGLINIESLYPGKYYWKITSTPDGYRIDSTSHSMVIDNNRNMDGENSVTVKYISIYIQHSDKIGGVEFSLFDEAGNVVSTTVTNGSGLALFEKINPGTYTLKQTKAPNGYNIFETEKKVIITKTFNNESNPIKFSNTDAPEETVQESSSIEQEETTYIFTPIEQDTSSIEETEDTSSISEPSNPSKQDNSFIVFIVIGAIVVGSIIGVTTAIIVRNKKKKKDEENEEDEENEGDITEENDNENEKEEIEDDISFSEATSSEEEIQEKVGVLEISHVLDIEKHNEASSDYEIDNDFGNDVGYLKQTKDTTSIDEENTLYLETANSDLGEIEDNKTVTKEEVTNHIETVIDNMYGNDSGALDSSNDAIIEQNTLSLDSANADIGTIESSVNKDNIKNVISSSGEDIDNIYGEDVGTLEDKKKKKINMNNLSASKEVSAVSDTTSINKNTEKHTYTSNKKKNRKKRK